MKIWINHKFVDEKKTVLSVFDRSYLYGEGLFETLRCYNGKPAFVREHYLRLKANCKRVNIPLPLSAKEMEKMMMALLRTNHLKEAAIRFTVSLEGASFGVDRPPSVKSNMTCFCRPLKINQDLYCRGAIVYPLNEINVDPPTMHGLKSTSYLPKMIARAAASKYCADETLVKNEEGFWIEGSATNLFIVKHGVIYTPPLKDGLLNGITRQIVLKILRTKKIPHKEISITTRDLKNADEIFITGTTKEVMPVREVKNLWKSTSNIFPTATHLHTLYHHLIHHL